MEGETRLDLFDRLVLVCLRHLLNLQLCQDVGEDCRGSAIAAASTLRRLTQPVAAISGPRQLLFDELDRLC